MIHTGSCHCGAVRIQVEAPADLDVRQCNCSMCERTGFLHLLVERSAFSLLSDQSTLTTYTFNTHTAQHYFCKICGCKPFYIPRSNPNGYSVNVRCLDKTTVSSIKVLPFDGKNWEANIHTL